MFQIHYSKVPDFFVSRLVFVDKAYSGVCLDKEKLVTSPSNTKYMYDHTGWICCFLFLFVCFFVVLLLQHTEKKRAYLQNNYLHYLRDSVNVQLLTFFTIHYITLQLLTFLTPLTLLTLLTLLNVQLLTFFTIHYITLHYSCLHSLHF